MKSFFGDWIAVTERLPKQLALKFIVFSKSRGVQWASWQGDYGWKGEVWMTDITHWMELPTEPKNV